MKYFIILLLSLFSLNAAASTKSKRSEKVQIKTTIYCDHCNQCSSCGKHLYDAIFEDNKGIKKVKVLAEENIIEVTFNPKKTDIKSIKETIAAAGFDADELPAHTVAYDKLDGCCKKKD